MPKSNDAFKLYPVMLDLAGKDVMIIGGGQVAWRKAIAVLNAGARVTVIAPQLCAELIALHEAHPGVISLLAREYRPGDLRGMSLVFAATDNKTINREVYTEAMQSNIFINAADEPEHCSFIVPSSIHKGDLIIAVSSGGTSPAFVRKIRETIESHLPENLELSLHALRHAREILKQHPAFADLDSQERGEILKTIVNDDTLLAQMIAACTDNKEIDFLHNLHASIMKAGH